MLANLQKPRPYVLTKADKAREAARQLRTTQTFVRKRDRATCRACRKPGNQVHHLVYRSHGGNDTAENLIYVCATCHRLIHAKVTLATFDPRNPAKTVRFTRNTQWDPEST